MEILKFIESECKTFEHLDDRSKASALLDSVNQKIMKNKRTLFNQKTDVVEMFNPLNIPENFLKELLNFYLNVGSFEVTTITQSKQDNEIFEKIKEKLQSVFN